MHKDPDIIHIKILRQQRNVPKIDLPCGIPFVSLNKPSTRQSIDLPDFIVIFLFFTAFFFLIFFFLVAPSTNHKGSDCLQSNLKDHSA